MPHEIAVTVNGRKRSMTLHHWVERIDDEQRALIMRCEQLAAGRYHAFECFVIVERQKVWGMHDDDIEALFIQRLRQHHKEDSGYNEFLMGYYGRDIPFVKDLRREE